MDQIWLIRHGVTRANRLGIIQGQSDEPLSDEGRRQAERLGRWLAAHEIAADALCSSPLSRAAETAAIVAAELGIDAGAIATEPRLAERSFGDLERQSAADVYGQQDAAADPGRWRPPNGESYADLEARALAGFDELAARQGRRALVFSHGGPIKALLCRALGLPFVPASFARLRCDNTGVSILDGASAIVTINARFHM